jgi:hypothetical protein
MFSLKWMKFADKAIQAAWYGILFYNMSLVFTRISILLLYKRIFTYSWAKRAIQVALVLVTATGIWFVASVATACVPLDAFWDWSLFMKTQVYCQPPNLWWGNAAIHIAGDLAIVILPVRTTTTLDYQTSLTRDRCPSSPA